MLRQETIQIIKSTVPVLEVHGTDITKRFYQLLFTQHPELLNIFNHANQKKGRQQTALANAVYAAAKHIDQLEAILPVVKEIGHKHRSLGIKPEHYPIVGENLLAAIKDVLGEAATDEIIQAWAEAYGVIADAFISVEADLYEKAERQEGGWEGFRPFRVEKKVAESDVITSFYLVPQDGNKIAKFEPGQYVSVKMEIPGEKNVHIRQYSLSDAPGKPYYRISVKREDGQANQPEGKVSTFLHKQVGEGDVLWLSAPAGVFTLDLNESRPIVFLSGGVGLTPMVSMLHTLLEKKPNHQATFIHSAQNGNVHAMKDKIEELAQKHEQVSVFWAYTEPTVQDRERKAYHKEGYIDLAWLKEVLGTTDARFYLCGPVPFMSAMKGLLLQCGVAESDIHWEFFGPAATL